MYSQGALRDRANRSKESGALMYGLAETAQVGLVGDRVGGNYGSYTQMRPSLVDRSFYPY